VKGPGLLDLMVKNTNERFLQKTKEMEGVMIETKEHFHGSQQIFAIA
jgi:hypothetical protein